MNAKDILVGNRQEIRQVKKLVASLHWLVPASKNRSPWTLPIDESEDLWMRVNTWTNVKKAKT